MSSDLWSRLWLLALAYPGLACLLIVLLSVAGTLVALAIVAMARPVRPADQRRDDEDQAAAVSGRIPLETWRRAGGNWRGEL